MPQISFHHYASSFGSRTVFKDLSVLLDWPDVVGQHGIMGMMGPSGAGKTTLLKAILATRYAGHIDGVEIIPKDLVIGFVPQVPVMFSNMDVIANARMFESIGRFAGRFDPKLFSRLSDILRLDSVMRQGRNIDGLSGGEIQRLMLLRTLSVKPDLLLLDEPAAGLDPAVRETFLIDLSELINELQINALYIGHHWDEVAFVSSRVAYLIAERDESLNMFVSRVCIMARADFQATPPTIDAFQSVYGPGCGIWPVGNPDTRYALLGRSAVQQRPHSLTACFPAVSNGNRRFIRSGSYRLAAESQLRRQPAWIYLDGEFLERADVDIGRVLADQ